MIKRKSSSLEFHWNSTVFHTTRVPPGPRRSRSRQAASAKRMTLA
jgi:hypothetical protein